MKRADATSIMTPTPTGRDVGSADTPKNSVSTFIVMALNMSWQLAIVILVPVIGGYQLDKRMDTSIYTFVGLGLAFLGSGLVMWRTMQVANSMPVPKLTAAQKRKIQKQYEAEDAER